jgi:hypothetical protein
MSAGVCRERTSWNWIGINRKLMIWTSGQTKKLAFSVGRYISRSLWVTARRPPPSAIVMTVKNMAIPRRYY